MERFNVIVTIVFVEYHFVRSRETERLIGYDDPKEILSMPTIALAYTGFFSRYVSAISLDPFHRSRWYFIRVFFSQCRGVIYSSIRGTTAKTFRPLTVGIGISRSASDRF